jgi:hypothetical protein
MLFLCTRDELGLVSEALGERGRGGEQVAL